jgi:uncharacterized protein involved in outer membrane biogenesis
LGVPASERVGGSGGAKPPGIDNDGRVKFRRKWPLVALAVLLVGALGTYFAARRALATDLVRTQLEQQLSARLGQAVTIGAVSASFFPQIAVDLRDVAVGRPVVVRMARVKVLTGLRALFADVVEVREVIVSDGRPGGADPPFVFDLEASVLGDRLDITSLKARGRTTRIDAKGVLTSIAGLEGALEATADPLDLNETIAIAGALSPQGRAPARGKPSPMHFVVKIAAPETRFGTYAFRNLSTTMDVAPGRTLLDALSLEMFGGSFTGRLDVDTHGDAPALRLTGSIARLDVPSLLTGSGSPGGLTGRLGGTVSIAAAGSDGAALMRTARGTINAVVSDGTLPRLDLVRTVVLAFGKPTGAPAEGQGTAFDRLGGTFALSNGTLRTENLALASRDFDTVGRGSLAIESGAVDARADVVLSPELTAQAGTDLRRYAQEDGRVRVPATLTGTLHRPRVSIDVAAAARRALGNELQRRATSFLEGLFKKKKGGG